MSPSQVLAVISLHLWMIFFFPFNQSLEMVLTIYRYFPPGFSWKKLEFFVSFFLFFILSNQCIHHLPKRILELWDSPHCTLIKNLFYFLQTYVQALFLYFIPFKLKKSTYEIAITSIPVLQIIKETITSYPFG